MTAEPIDPYEAGGPMEVTITDARNNLYQFCDHAGSGEFIYLTRNGRRIAALVASEVAEDAERREDEYWSARARDAHQRIAAGEDEVISFDQLVAEAEGRA